MYETKLTAVQGQRQTEGSSGGFYPFGYYAARGFDASLIENNSKPEDIQTHPVLGLTYRVNIECSNNSSTKKVFQKREAKGAADHGFAKEA